MALGLRGQDKVVHVDVRICQRWRASRAGYSLVLLSSSRRMCGLGWRSRGERLRWMLRQARRVAWQSVKFDRSQAVSVATVKYGGLSTHPMGSARGRATKGSPPRSVE